MNSITKKIELMSPAGSFEAMAAAIKGGCNSIYFGVEQLNMRARSSINFTTDDLPQIAKTCHDADVKAYVTLNTIIYDHDLSLMRNIVDAVRLSGIDAVIASDHSVMNYARKTGVPVHISTQTNITNIETVEFYSAYSEVMVMARELSLSQVYDITREIERRKITGPSGNNLRVEIFCHGALCMAVSGKCYLSLHSDQASANRGACIQNCRHSYLVIDKESGNELEIDNEFIMSAQDLCTIGFLDKIIDAGVSVMKIEGRGRSAEYVYTTTKCYREAIDSYFSGNYSTEKVKEWMNQLSTVYNRGFWDGYYLGQKMGEWSQQYGSKATRTKIYLGKGLKFYEKAQAADFELEAQWLKVGDEILITGPTTGVIQTRVEELRVNNEKKEKALKGEVVSIPLAEKIRPSDKLYKLVDA